MVDDDRGVGDAHYPPFALLAVSHECCGEIAVAGWLTWRCDCRRVRPGQSARPATSRAPYRFNRRVDDREYVGRIRRHTPSSLLPLVAQVGAQFADRAQWLAPRAPRPWALADIGASRAGARHRVHRSTATVAYVIECADRLSKPSLTPTCTGTRRVSLPTSCCATAGEQLIYQQEISTSSPGRRRCSTSMDPSQPPRVISAMGERGCSLAPWGSTQRGLRAACRRPQEWRHVRFSLDFDQPQFATPRTPAVGLNAHAVRAALRRRRDTRRDPAESRIRSAAGAGVSPFGFNPLQKYRSCPARTIVGTCRCAPAHTQASPIGVFFAGFDHLARSFADDLARPSRAISETTCANCAAPSCRRSSSARPDNASVRSTDRHLRRVCAAC